MPKVIEAKMLATGKTFGIIVSRFNDFITERLLSGAVDALVRSGARDEDIHVVKVPGAFEIPLLAKKIAAAGRYDAVICLGAVIRGATPHFDYVSAEVSKGVALVGMESDVPVIFGKHQLHCRCNLSSGKPGGHRIRGQAHSAKNGPMCTIVPQMCRHSSRWH